MSCQHTLTPLTPPASALAARARLRDRGKTPRRNYYFANIDRSSTVAAAKNMLLSTREQGINHAYRESLAGESIRNSNSYCGKQTVTLKTLSLMAYIAIHPLQFSSLDALLMPHSLISALYSGMSPNAMPLCMSWSHPQIG